MQKLHEAWDSLPPEKTRTTPEEFFKASYGFDLDSSSRTHNQHLSAIKEFLDHKVGREAYLARLEGVTHYVKWDVKGMMVSDKIQHVLNENIGRELTVLDVQELILMVFDCVAHRTQISTMLKLLCDEIPTASRHLKSGNKAMFYSFPDTIQDSALKAATQKYYKATYERKKNPKKKPNKYFSSKEERKLAEEKSKMSPLFKPENFVEIKGKTLAILSREDAERANDLFVSTLEKLKDAKCRLAAIIDENQELNQKIRIMSVTSISHNLDEIEKQI